MVSDIFETEIIALCALAGLQLMQQGQVEAGQQLAAQHEVAQYANHVLQASQVGLFC